MEAHADDLRAEVAEIEDDTFVDRFTVDWRSADLTPLDGALMVYAEKLTRTPWDVRPEDLDRLRAAGATDDEISDAAQVIAYFNYINRIADGLGVDLEPSMPPDPRGG